MNYAWRSGDPVIACRGDRQWEFRPAPLFADSIFTLFLLVAIGCGVMAAFFFSVGRGSPVGVVFGSLIGLVAVFSVWRALRARRLQNTPLIIHDDGRVCYDNRELSPAQLFRAVELRRVVSGEEYSYNVAMLPTEGAEVHLPSPYFTGFLHLEQARRFARGFAAELRLELVERC